MRPRRKRIPPDADESGIDLTPLLDVVFIMLIFFIVTATFTQQSGIEINRPMAATSNQLEGESIIIAIDKNNQIWLDDRNIDARTVKSHIAKIRTRNPKAALIIEADRESQTDQVIRVMDGARRAGVTEISIASEKN